jgi:hypothetical protein
MILRRLTQSLKDQNWTAIVIEFVLLVTGVFLGIQVSNWNQSQADVRLGRDYVRRLIHDLDKDRIATGSELAYYTAVLHSVRETDELLRAANPDARMLISSAYRASEVTYTAPVRATWDQIVSSGHLGLLPTNAVESSLSLYYSFDVGQDTYRLGLASPYRRTVRSIIPISMQAAIREGCSDVRDRRGTIVGFTQRCEFNADPAALKQAADALRNDPAVVADLRFQYGFAVSSRSNLQGQYNTIGDALAVLGAKPAAKSEPAP